MTKHQHQHGKDGMGNDDKSKAFQLRESQLRKRLEEKPKNARLMSELALHLAQPFKELEQNPDDGSPKKNDFEYLHKEAIVMAKRAIEKAPHKPFGYAALSDIYPQGSPERMEMLQQAIVRSESDPKQIIALTCLLTRQLLEPRESEARRVNMGKAAVNHPNRRPLSSAEESLYETIRGALTKAWSGTDGTLLSVDQTNFLAFQEYRLGLFFRKKDPPSTSLPRARHHLTSCLEQYSTIPPIREAPPSSKNKVAMAKFWLGTLEQSTDTTTSNQVSRCPPEYIVGLYSTFADRFDELLVEKLEYKTPTMLRHLFDQTVGLSNLLPLEHCLDLGCGTGISGLAFQQVVQRMDGVDLSPEMIAKAKERQCYNSLKVADVVNALDESTAKYDLILACDVFCYIGDLTSVFGSVKRLLSTNGFFCFSTELLQNPQQDETFRLHSCARFSHTQEYILQLAAKYDFEIVGRELAECLRKNQGSNVKGMLTIVTPR